MQQDGGVPERSGRRVRVDVLRPFNCGRPFRIVRLGGEAGGGELAVVDERISFGGTTWTWRDRQLLSTPVPTESVEAVVLPLPNECAYTEQALTIGGVGKHLRWMTICNPPASRTDPTRLRVSRIADSAAFVDLMDARVRPFAFLDGAPAAGEARLLVPDNSKVRIVAALLHSHGLLVESADEASSTLTGKLAIERYDRASHMWNTDAADPGTGPRRDTHRYCFAFAQHWEHIPFTWTAMAKNIDLPIADLPRVPLPLRNHVVDRYLEDAETEAMFEIDKAREEELAALVSRLRRVRRRDCVTCRLTVRQNRQLLCAAYWAFVAPFDAEIVSISHALLFRYMLHGYTAREVGRYNQTALYLGHGAFCRDFKAMPQYKPENLPEHVLARVSRGGDRLRGSGFKGTRGKYGAIGFPKYVPGKRFFRSQAREAQMMHPVEDVFSAYAELRSTPQQ